MPSIMALAEQERVRSIQSALAQQDGIEGWLFYDFRGSDPIGYRILLLDPTMHVTRRWYYWIPASGSPRKLIHRIEPHTLDRLPGQEAYYISWEQQRQLLSEILKGCRRIAMQYSPLNAVPYVSRVDAGTIDVIRSFGIEVVSSADLVQWFEAVWTDRQLESHQYAATALRRIVDEAFDHARNAVCRGKSLTEYALQQFILSRIKESEMMTSSAPIVAVNEHSADPHYGPGPNGSAEIKRDNLILIDLWAKQRERGSVYADITWTAFTGSRIPSQHQDIFNVVRLGRDTALEFVRSRVQAGEPPLGHEVDDACRAVIAAAGYGDQFLHRTGHSIGEEVHGNGANIDGLETYDTRRLMPHTCFSIEPGIYIPGQFGIRSEVDVYVSDRDVHVFGLPMQQELAPLL